MRNVIISKVSRYIFTEGQLKARWEEMRRGKPFAEAADKDLVGIALDIFRNTSFHDLIHHLPGGGYRMKEEMTGRTLLEDSVHPGLHIEVIDTDEKGDETLLVLDRVLKMECQECGFLFYVDDVRVSPAQLKCPRCQGEVRSVISAERNKRVEGSF